MLCHYFKHRQYKKHLENDNQIEIKISVEQIRTLEIKLIYFNERFSKS